ncbi:hypothetical protein NY70_005032 [Salmonella enterica subsp. enterica]|nr:hypothetical protein [Salmonella enterica subsp. enterica]
MNVATIRIAPRILNAEKINSTTIYSPPNKKACDYQRACYKLSDVDGHCLTSRSFLLNMALKGFGLSWS